MVEILSGDLKGTKIITTLKERIGFDGTPKGATTVKTKLMLETSFWISLALSFVGDSEIKNAVGDGFYDLGEYVKVKYPQETTKKTPKLEAAKALEPAKEAIKPQTTSSQNQQTKPKTSLQSTIEAQDKKSQMQTNPSIFAKTDRFSYSSGDQIIVFGAVNEIQKNLVVTILITRPDGETVTMSQTDVSQNGKFADTFKASGPLWKTSGIYTVSVKYGILGYQTTFEFKNKMTDLQTNTQPIVIWIENLTPGSTVIELKGLSNTGTSIPITISVTNPSGNIVAIDRISINQDGSFMTQIKTGGPLWKQDGSYIIKVQQGDSVNTNKIAKIQVDIANGAAVSSSSIFVKTNKSSYSDGETVLVSGQVSEIFPSIPASLRVIAPNGYIIVIEQVDVKSDKTFIAEISAGGNLWKSVGTYTVEVSYGTTSQNTSTATTTFEFGGSSGGKPSTTVSVDGTNFLLSYTITGGKVLSITPNYAATLLEIAIDAINDGQLTIVLPRALIDSKFNGQDESFFVLVDGEERNFDETKTSTDRTLTTVFEKSAKKIKVIGTYLAS